MVNFDGLPKNLQAKLNEFRYVAKSVDDAISMAKAKGTWTEADDKVMSALNGNKAFGVFDVFERAQADKKSDPLAQAIKKDPVSGMRKVFAENLAEDAKKNPEKYAPKYYTLDSGRVVAYQKSKETGKDTYTYYDTNGKEMKEKDFYVKEGIKSLAFIKGNEKSLPKLSGSGAKTLIANNKGKLYVEQYNENADTNASINNFTLFTGCSNGDNITEYKFLNEDTNNIRVTVTAELSSLEAMINKLIEKIPDLSVLQELLKEVQALRKDENANSKDTQVILIRILAAIGDNQKALEIIINEIGDNNDLIKVVIDKLTEGNQTLSDIRDLLKQNNTDNKVIMQLLARIQTLLKNNNKISLDIYNMIKNIDPKDYTAQLNKIIELLEQLDKNNDIRTANVIAAINKLGDDVAGNLAAILEAIQKLPASEQKDYTEILNAILDKIKEGNAQNDANFKAVLDKIKDLGVSVAYGMNAILEAIQNQPDYTSRLDAIIAKLDALGAKAQEILEAIKDHDVKITVDVTGKVTCECNCNCGKPHEGIIGDLEDLLG